MTILALSGSNLTTNGFVKTSGGDGTLSIDTNTYITGNQTITLSGDITGSGTTGITTAIAPLVIVDGDINASAAITLSKLAALTVSRALVSDGSGVISVSSVTSTELGYLSGVTSAIQTQLNAKQATGNYITALTGDVTASGPGSVTATIANDAVTYAKIQNVSAASKLLGRGSAGGSGDVEEITLGSGLSMSGTTLSATGSGTPAGSNTQIQYNNAGSFGADANFAWDSVNQELEFGDGTTILGGGELFINSGGDGGILDFSAASATTLNNSGGEIYIYGGQGNGAGSGGLMGFFSGSGGATGNGGIAEIAAGSGGATLAQRRTIRIVWAI